MKPVKRSQGGMTLIELMVAIVLGLLIVAAAGSAYLGNLGTFKTTTTLARIQESSRSAYELLGRDIREAGGNGCNASLTPINLLKDRDQPFWATLGRALTGVDADQAFLAPDLTVTSPGAQRIAGTDALDLWLSAPLDVRVLERMQSRTAGLRITPTTQIKAGDALQICDFELSSVFRATSTGAEIGHAEAANCSGGFTDRDACGGGPGSEGAWHRYGQESLISKPKRVRWYVANKDGGKALMREVLEDGKQIASGAVIVDIEQFRLSYLLTGDERYLAASQISPNQWKAVRAVRIELLLNGQKTPTAEDASISRSSTQTIQLRNSSS